MRGRRTSRRVSLAGVGFRAGVLSLVTILFLSPSVAAEELNKGDAVMKKGSSFPALTLPDQNGTPHSIGPATKVVVFTRDMNGGELVKSALAASTGDSLTPAHVAYVCDISPMPRLVRSMFALPGLRKRTYPVMLDDSGDVTKNFPYAEGKATVLTLDAGIVESVAFAGSSAEVTAAVSK